MEHLSGTETIRLIMKSGGTKHPDRGARCRVLFHDRQAVRGPVRGPFCLARMSRHEVPTTPGYLRFAIYATPIGCRTDGLTRKCDTLAGS